RYYKSDLKAASASISPKRLLEILDRRRQLVDDHERDVLSGWSRFVERRTREMENLEGKLTALDPTRVLSRGYSICRDEATGRIIKTVSQVANGKLLRTTVSDGDVMSRVDAAASAGQKSLEFDRQ
ncbi:MAG TPA: exodeoxyribonuclease VII large subunit, partial [bacterium]|nr:exodeoxyribonuclease VII large subunit [bacterium]